MPARLPPRAILAAVLLAALLSTATTPAELPGVRLWFCEGWAADPRTSPQRHRESFMHTDDPEAAAAWFRQHNPEHAERVRCQDRRPADWSER